MIKSELIKKIAAKNTDLSLKDSEVIVNKVFDVIGEALINDNRVELRGFGAWSTRKREAREARNPKTGEKVKLKKRKTVYFRSGKGLQERLNNS